MIGARALELPEHDELAAGGAVIDWLFRTADARTSGDTLSTRCPSIALRSMQTVPPGNSRFRGAPGDYLDEYGARRNPPALAGLFLSYTFQRQALPPIAKRNRRQDSTR
jgi:hypothetical protein